MHFISVGSVFTGVLVRGVLVLSVLVRGVPELTVLVLGEVFSCLVCDLVDERRFFTLPSSFLLSLLKNTKITATRDKTAQYFVIYKYQASYERTNALSIKLATSGHLLSFVGISTDLVTYSLHFICDHCLCFSR